MPTVERILPLFLLAAVVACGDGHHGQQLTEPEGQAMERRGPVASSSDDGFRFLPPIGTAARPAAPLQADLLPFLTVEVCRLDGEVCAAVIESFDARGSGPRRLRVEDDHFHVNWQVDRDMNEEVLYSLRVRVGPLQLGQVPVVVRSGGALRATDALPVHPGRTVPVKFRVEASSRWSSLSSDLTFDEPVTIAGRIVAWSGTAAPEGAELDILIDGRVAPALQDRDGTIRLGVPLFIEGGAWPTPPPGELDVMLFVDGEPVAWMKEAMTVTPPPEAPGSSEEALAHAATIADAWATLTAGTDNPSLQEAWAISTVGAFDALINGDSELSLRAALETADPETVRLLDAWFAASGVLDALEEYASALEAIAGLAAGTGSPSAVLTDVLASMAIGDVGSRWPANYLAKQMQLAMVAREFGQTALNGYSTQVGYLGTAASLLAPYVAVPAVGAYSAILGLIDFIANKVVIATLPSRVDALTLEIPDATLGPGEQTIADVRIQARNQPPAIGFQEVIAQLISIAGIQNNTQPAQDFADFLFNAVTVFRNVVQAQFATYAASHPELNLDFTTSVPEMVWWATVLDETLVEPRTLAPGLLTAAPDGIDWVAASDAFGQGDVYAAINTGPESYRLELPPGFTYAGGAFGEDILASETVTIRVVGDLVLAVNFADQIDPDGFNALEARAGYLTATDDTVWTGGIWIELAVDGGEVETAEGPTDIDGQFITLARLSEGSDEIIITVSAYDDAAQNVSQTVSAQTTELDGEPGPVYVGTSSSVETAACYGEEYVGEDVQAWIDVEENDGLTRVRYSTSHTGYRYYSRRGAWRYYIFEGTLDGSTFNGVYAGFGDQYDNGSVEEYLFSDDQTLSVTFSPDRLAAEGRRTWGDGCDYQEFELVNEGAREPVDMTGSWSLGGFTYELEQTGNRISGTATDLYSYGYWVYGSVIGNGVVGLMRIKSGYYGSPPSGFAGLALGGGDIVMLRGDWRMTRQ